MRLLQNELYKLLRSKKLYLFILIFVAMRIMAVYFYNADTDVQTVIEVASAQSLPIALKYDAVQFMVIFTAIYMADIVTDEVKTGTIKLTLLRSNGRARLLQSKMAAMAAFVVLFTLFSVVVTYAIGCVAFGWGDSTVYRGVTYSIGDGLLLTAKVYAASILPLVAFGTICLLVAVVARSLVTVVAVAFVLFLLGEFLSALSVIPSAIRSCLIVNQLFFFSDSFVNNNPDSEIALSVAVNLSYIAVFYWLTAAIFKRKNILS
ncbi:MAG: ABC transporter permease [Paenibacillaceae bacterium]|nr:ABC transporter permease [Paenibacillaceae bacterium]